MNPKDNKHKNYLINSWRALKLIWNWKKTRQILVWFGFSLLIVASLPFVRSGVSGLVINELVDLFGSGEFTEKIIYLLIGLFFIDILLPIFRNTNSYFEKMFGFQFGEEIEPLMLQKHAEIDVATKEDPKNNDLFQRVNENLWRVDNFVRRQFWMFESFLEMVVAIVIVIFVDWWILVLIILSNIPAVIIEAKYGAFVWSIHSGKGEVRRKFWNLRNHFTNLTNVIELKIFQNTKYFLDQVKSLFREFNNEQKKSEKKRLYYEFGAGILSEAVFAISTIWFVYLVLQGEMQIGTFTFMVASMGRLQGSLASFFRHLGRQYQDSLFVSDFFEFLDLPPAIKKPKKGHRLPTDKTPEIVFDKVSFNYPGTNKVVLKNLNLTVKPGEKIALVGINGAGKTTFVKLLARFYDPSGGNIYVDGQNLKDINLDSWYEKLGILFQDYANYHLLVEEAIGVGRIKNRDKKIERIQEAAKAAEADTFIEEWESEYKQQLGRQFTRGIEPSVGQWQKLALARTFYRDPRILILDEPTSSVDAEAEAKIFKKLEKLPSDRSVFLISHRFSTVRHADKIIVIENGEISESGTHEELLEKDKTYAKLFKLQAKGYK